MLGTWVDRASSRLATLITTIMANRISIISACACWIFIVGDNTRFGHRGSAPAGETTANEPEIWSRDFPHGVKITLFVVALIFGVFEHLSRTMNTLSIERDWLPTLAPPHDVESEYGLAELNAGIGRIDLICKLFSPIFFSTFISVLGSTRIGILGVLALNCGTWTLEIWSARRLWKMNGRVREPKQSASENISTGETDSLITREGGQAQIHRVWPNFRQFFRRNGHFPCAAFSAPRIWLLDYYQNLTIFFSHPVWIPSMALSVVHFSVLNYSATLTVYLLNSGFSLNMISVAKMLSGVCEISSTFFTPWAVRRMGATLVARHPGRLLDNASVNTPLFANLEQERINDHQENIAAEDKEDAVFIPETDMGVAMLGFFGLAQMEIFLLPALGALWFLSSYANGPSQAIAPSTIITTVLVLTISFSRFGRWTNHLATRQLTQTLVPAAHRSGFAGAEAGFVSLFELGHWVATAVWNQRGQFRWHAISSVLGVAVSTAAYGVWLRRVVREGRTRQ